jgi:dephospho-CoA kinase
LNITPSNSPQSSPNLAPDETLLLSLKPSPLSVVMRSWRAAAWAVVLAVLGWAGSAFLGTYATAYGLQLGWVWAAPGLIGLAFFCVRLVREVLLWQSRCYTLTSVRMLATSGVVRRTRVEVPLRNIQQIALDRTGGERVLGLGTIVVTSAGSQTIDLAWVSIDRSEERLAEVRKAMAVAVPMPVWLEERPEVSMQGSLPGVVAGRVIGLVGGIGAGKSQVARALEDLGFAVIDSDKEAKAALDRPEVRERLVKWWGDRVLEPTGRVDRKRVAEIVFSDPAQRTRLEELVHPLVKLRRSELVARAMADGAMGVVVDAPLLLEAGVDQECDYVVFVDAPLEVREARVRGRGWEAGELARREKAQLPLEEKRRRADIAIVNDGSMEVLAGRVRAMLTRLMAQPTRAARSAGSGTRTP